MLKKLNLTKYLLILTFFVSFLIACPILAEGLKDGFISTPGGTLDTFASKANYSPAATPEYYIGLALTMLFSLIGIIVMGMIFYSGFV